MVTDSIRSLAAAMVAFALLVIALVVGKEILIPFALAALFAFILEPIVLRLTYVRLPRGLAATATVIAVVALSATLTYAFSTQLIELTANVTSHQQNLIKKVRDFRHISGSASVLEKAGESVEVLEKEINKEILGKKAATEPKTVVVAKVNPAEATWGARLQAIAGPLTATALTILFTIFLLIQSHDLRDRVVRVAGVDNMSVTVAALSEAGERLSNLFLMQALLNTGFGIFVGIVLGVIGVPNPLLWGTATALLRFIPLVGSLLAAIPPILLAAAVDPGWTLAAMTLAVFVIGEPIMGHVIEPLVLGKTAGLSPFALILSASFWTLVWGPIGLLLAAPLTMTIVVLGQYLPKFEFVSILLGDMPALSPAQELYHRLLSSDAAAAFEHLSEHLETASVTKISEELVFPALALAATDHRIGRLEDSQILSVEETMDEFSALVAEEILEEDTVEKSMRKKDTTPIVLLPLRGPFDRMSAHYLQNFLEPQTDKGLFTIEKATGLLGASSLKQALGQSVPSSVVLVASNEYEPGLAQHIQRRIKRDFPDAKIVIFAPCFTGEELTPEKSALAAGRPVRYKSVKGLADAILHRSLRTSARAPRGPVDQNSQVAQTKPASSNEPRLRNA